MALSIKIETTDAVVERLTAVRTSTDPGNSDPDSVNEYIVYRVTEVDRVTTADSIGRVSHRYGDGATKLVRTMLDTLDQVLEEK